MLHVVCEEVQYLYSYLDMYLRITLGNIRKNPFGHDCDSKHKNNNSKTGNISHGLQQFYSS